jgi:plasmid stabilization system protein ParE
MRIHWTNNAVDHLVNIHRYISLNSPTYAKAMVDRITRRSSQIACSPLSGRMVPEYQATEIREIIEKPYRIIYCIKKDQIDVLAVIHGARLLPGEL